MVLFKSEPAFDAEYVNQTALVGKALLGCAQLNKGTAFSQQERDAFQLHGLLPAAIETMEQQLARHYAQYEMFQTDLERNVYLHALYNNNEMLFYQLIARHLIGMLPVIYTPTVGAAVEKFSAQFRRERGLYLCYEDRRHMRVRLQQMLAGRDVDTCIVTDGTAVLGIGDQGIGGMAIAIGKQIVYALCGGVSPMNVLPIQLDLGTDNEALLADPGYLGWRHRRVTGQAYDDFIAQFVSTITDLVPGMYIHWEDVAREQAVAILTRYQQDVCTFNDDIQGTGAVTMACLLAALAQTGQDLTQQRIVIHGAGAAALGIAEHLSQAMQGLGLSETDANRCFYLLNRRGLLTDDMSGLNSNQMRFAQPRASLVAWSQQTDLDLLQVVTEVKPTVLIGCSTQAGAFNEKVVRTMAKHVKRPIILPLSNPSDKSEVVPEDAIRWTDGQALVATGSPFAPVTYKGKCHVISQCNNALIYPAVGLGVRVSRAKRVTFGMLQAASEALSVQAQQGEDQQLLPALSQFPKASIPVAVAVAKQARDEDVAGVGDEVDLQAVVEKWFWQPGYRPMERLLS